MSKRNFVSNTFMCKCPRCQQGDLYIKPFSFAKPVDMPENCPECGQSFLPEPGFYYGAMFLSYIVSGFFFLGVVGLCIIGFGMTVNAAMGILLIVALLIYFPLLRCSRSLWINLMVRYDADAIKNKDSETYKTKF